MPGIGLYHLQRVFAEGLDDPAGKLRPDSPDQPASQIFLDPVNRRRKGLLESFQGELTAVLRVDLPVSLQLQDASHMNLRHEADHGDQVPEPLCPATDHRVAVLLIMIGDALHDTAKLFHPSPPAAGSLLLSSAVDSHYSENLFRT